MKKIILIMALICTVFLCGCADSTKPAENVKTAEQGVAEKNLSPSQKSLAEFRKVISDKNGDNLYMFALSNSPFILKDSISEVVSIFSFTMSIFFNILF